jgi:hypothetical protein
MQPACVSRTIITPVAEEDSSHCVTCPSSLPRDNPVSPLPRVRRILIFWIGGLLGLLVLSGCKSDRLSERGQPFSDASISSILHGLRS